MLHVKAGRDAFTEIRTVLICHLLVVLMKLFLMKVNFEELVFYRAKKIRVACCAEAPHAHTTLLSSPLLSPILSSLSSWRVKSAWDNRRGPAGRDPLWPRPTLATVSFWHFQG